MAKEFFWKDKSGRDFTNTFSEGALREAFNEEHDTNWDGETISEWLEMEPDEGDEWENAVHKVIRTK